MVKTLPARRIADYALLLIAFGLGAYAVYNLRQAWTRQPNGGWMWWLLMAAGLAGGIALSRVQRWLPDAQPIAHPVEAVLPAWRQRWGVACIVLAVGLVAWVVWRLWPDPDRWDGAFGLWGVALALAVTGSVLIGAVGRPALDELGARVPAGQIPPWLEIVAFLLIVALAVFLRTYHLDQIPAGIFKDETNSSLDALYILEGSHVSPFVTGWYETPNAYVYYMALVYKFLGANYYGLKVVSLIPAILTVLAVYPLGRLLFGPPVGLCAMFLAAVSRWHLSLSRWGWNELVPPLLMVLAMFFLIRGLRERRARDYALGGALTGLALYTYLSSRLMIFALLVFSSYWLLADPNGPVAGWKRHWRGLAIFWTAAVLVVAPLCVHYIKNPNTFINRTAQVSILKTVRQVGSYQPILDNLQATARVFHQIGDPSPRHNLPGEPQADPLTGVLFVIGLGYGLFNLRDRRRGVLILWLVITMAGAYLTEIGGDSPNTYRTLTALPAIVLLAGEVMVSLARGLIWLIPASGDAMRVWATRLGSGVVILGLVGSAAWESDIYFGRQAQSPTVQAGFDQTESRVARDVVATLQGGNAAIYLTGNLYSFSPLRFLTYGLIKQRTGENSLDHPPYFMFRPALDLPVPDTGQEAVFLLEYLYWPVRDYVRLFYPRATFEVMSWDNMPLYFRVRVTEEQMAATKGLTARFMRANGQVEEMVVAEIDEDWSQHDAIAAEWNGSLRLAHSGVYTFTSQGTLMLTVDGQPWTDSRFMGSGLHAFQVAQTNCQAQGVARLKWMTPNGIMGVVPAQVFSRVDPPRQGLTGYYYGNPDWTGAPLFKQITPLILLNWPDGEPVAGPFSARFVGLLRITQPGSYHFLIHADDGVRLSIDGVTLGEGLVRAIPNSIEPSATLAAGDHSIEIDYFQVGGGSQLDFYWKPPGAVDWAPVPPNVLLPEAR